MRNIEIARPLRSLCAGALVTALLPGALPALAAPAPAMFRCNPQHTGVCAASDLAAKAPKVLWKFRTGNLNRSTPLVSGGVVYVGSNNGNLYALDAGSGRLVWKYHTDGELSSSPAAAFGAVYFNGGDGNIYALDAKTGKERWVFKAGKLAPFPDPYPWDFFQSSPAVVGSLMYVGSGDGNVYALNARSGALAWRFKTQGRVRSSPAVDNGVVFAGSMDGNLYALNASDGLLKWKFKTKGNSDFPLGEVQSSPTVAGGAVYFGSRDGFLYALNERTGKKTFAIDEQGSWVISSPAVENNLLVYGTSDGRSVRAVNAKTGKTKWTYNALDRVFSSPIFVGGRIYIGLCDTETISLDPRTGKPGIVVGSEGTIYSSPIVSDGILYFTSDDGYVYAAK